MVNNFYLLKGFLEYFLIYLLYLFLNFLISCDFFGQMVIILEEGYMEKYLIIFWNNYPK